MGTKTKEERMSILQAIYRFWTLKDCTYVSGGKFAENINPEDFAIDVKDYPKDQATRYCRIYQEILTYTGTKYVVMFYIADLIKAIKKVPKGPRNALLTFFGIKGNDHYLRELRSNDQALSNMVEDAMEAVNYLRGFSLQYIFNEEMHETIEACARKVYDPEHKYDTITKAKLAYCYAAYIRPYDKMYYDLVRGDKGVQDDDEKRIEASAYFTGNVITRVYESVLQYMPDEDIIADMVAEYVWEFDADYEDVIYKDCQFERDDRKIACKVRDTSDEQFQVVQLGLIRRIKERIFSSGAWDHGDFCTFSSLENLRPETILDMIKAYRYYIDVLEYEWDGVKEVIDGKVVLRQKGESTYTVPKLSDHIVFKSGYELMMFCHFIDYLYKHESDRVFHGKKFSEWNFNSMLYGKVAA